MVHGKVAAAVLAVTAVMAVMAGTEALAQMVAKRTAWVVQVAVGGYASSTYGFAGGGGVGLRGEDGGGQLGASVDPSQQTSPFNSGNSFYSDYRYSGPGGSGGEHGGPPSNGTGTLTL